ncbi:MAG: Na+/H+ antiporter NhaC family protein [Clostridia bacterium]|nr:Na+/H+ antiporter NhaC family protein [Clostridia bacterium]
MKAKKILLPIIAAIVIIAIMVVAYFALDGKEVYGTYWSLLAPIVAIALALITKEVYSSLFIGVTIGAVLSSGFSFSRTFEAIVSSIEVTQVEGETIYSGGLISAINANAGIFIFLVLLGIVVALVNKSGGSQAFGRWAQKHIKTKVGALLATFLLGVLIFVDDYFNCLTVGSVMAPVTDSHKISRAKLAFIIDATAAPICMIAPVSSWAAAVSSYYSSENLTGIELFIRAIPYNFYSLLTIGFVILLSVLAFDYGKMSGAEIKAQSGDLGMINVSDDNDNQTNEKGRVFDLLIPIIVLVIACVAGLLYNGGFFSGESFIAAFENTSAGDGLSFGAMISIVFIVIYLIARGLVSFKDAMSCISKGFVAMVPAIIILTLATCLKDMTVGLGSKVFVGNVMSGVASGFTAFLPALIFIVACLIAFATGTSWGTAGILIPIVASVFTNEADPLFFIGISACLAGAVCGDHCSPISDTTIMASAGAQCNHIEHVSTQLPYAITIAAISFVSFIIAGFVKNVYISLAAAFALLIVTVLVIKMITKKKEA